MKIYDGYLGPENIFDRAGEFCDIFSGHKESTCYSTSANHISKLHGHEAVRRWNSSLLRDGHKMSLEKIWNQSQEETEENYHSNVSKYFRVYFSNSQLYDEWRQNYVGMF